MLEPQRGAVPPPRPSLAHPALLGRCAARRAALPAVRRLRSRHPHARVPLRALHVAEPHVGAERGHRQRLQLDDRVAPADPGVRGPVRRGHRRHGRGLADALQSHRLRARRRRDRDAGRCGVPPALRRVPPAVLPAPSTGADVQQGLSALRVVDFSFGIPGGYCCRLLADAGADVVKIEPPDGDPLRVVVGRRCRRRPRRGRRVVPLPAPRHALGGRRTRLTHEVADLIATADVVIESNSRSRRRRSTRTRCSSPHPGLVVLLGHAVRPQRAVRRTADHRVHRAGGVRGPPAPRFPPGRAVPGRRPHERVVGGHVRRRGGRGRGAPGAAHRPRRAHRLLGLRGDDDRRQQLRGVHACVARRARRSTGPSRTIETPSVEPTLDGYVGFCTNSREQFNSFLLLIERPDLIEDDPFASVVARARRAGTSGTRSSTRGRRSTRPPTS